MIGYIAYREDVKTWAVEEKNILGLRFLRLTLPKGRRVLGKHYAGRAARAMGKLGVRQAVFPTDFPWQDLFTRRGVLPVDTLLLYRRMAPQIVKKQMADLGLSPGSTTVAAVGDNLNGELGRILTELALQVRYLTVSMKYGAEEFCHSLRREYGGRSGLYQSHCAPSVRRGAGAPAQRRHLRPAAETGGGTGGKLQQGAGAVRSFGGGNITKLSNSRVRG